MRSGRRGGAAAGPVAAVLAGYFLLLAAIGGSAEWDRLGVPDMQPSFADLRSLTSAWECDRLDTPVLPANPCDPYGGRPANYPTVWLAPSVLGLGQDATVPLGIASAAIFLGSLLFLLARARARAWPLCAALAVSPGVMFAVERGNVDILLFALMVASLAIYRRSPVGRAGAHALLLAAALLKLFPVFAWGVLARQPRRIAIPALTGMVSIFVVYAAVTADTIRTIEQVVPQIVPLSYGADVGIDSLGLGDRATAIALVAAAISIAALARGRARPSPSAAAAADARSAFALDAFVAGAGIYVASFALWHNYDYRLIFVLLALPQLTIWAGSAGRSPVPAPRLALAALTASLWLSLPLNASIGFWIAPLEFLTLGRLGVSIDELANWALFVCLGAGLVAVLATAPLLSPRRNPSPPRPAGARPSPRADPPAAPSG